MEKKQKLTKMPQINAHAAGIDIGSEQHYVAIGQGRDQVKSFRAFTTDLHQMAKWLKENDITTVAMESTGSYWIPLYEILEKEGFEVFLVNAAHVKNVPGRKTDVLDCQWLQQLHSFGLLRASFIPIEKIRTLRAYLRLQEEHIHQSTTHIHHMQKALDQMNVKLHDVISETMGISGQRVLRSIVSGERNPEALAGLCEASILKKKHQEVILSLQGNYKPEHVFALKQALESYDFCQQQISACDQEVEVILKDLTKGAPPIEGAGQPKKIRRRQPSFDLRNYVLKLTGGIDIAGLPGFTDLTALQLISEIGLDMTRWPTEKHFTAWLGLAPHNKISGGRVLSKGTIKRKSRASQIFRLAARVVSRSSSSFGSFYRRIKNRSSAAVANVSTARKLAVQIYRLFRYGYKYVEIGAQAYEQNFQKQQIKWLERKAKRLGFQLVAV